MNERLIELVTDGIIHFNLNQQPFLMIISSGPHALNEMALVLSVQLLTSNSKLLERLLHSSCVVLVRYLILSCCTLSTNRLPHVHLWA